MPADAQALTLADYATQSNDIGVKELVKSILMPTSILNDIPLITNASLRATVMRLLPSGLGSWNGWGQVNKDPNTFRATFEDFEEAVYLVRQKFQIDTALLEAPNWIGDPFEMQLSAWRDALNYELNMTFIQNNQSNASATVNRPDAWQGLRTRIDAGPTGIYKVPAKNKLSSGVNFKSNMTDGDAQTMMEQIGTMFAFLGSPDGTDICIYTNYLMKERLARAFRQTKQWDYSKDAFGRTVEKFRNATVRDLGWQSDSDTPIIGVNENSDGTDGTPGTTSYSSLYFVHYGNTWMRGWQRKEIKLQYLGKSTETGVYENAIIDWGVGLLQPHPRSIGRIYGIQLG